MERLKLSGYLNRLSVSHWNVNLEGKRSFGFCKCHIRSRLWGKVSRGQHQPGMHRTRAEEKDCFRGWSWWEQLRSLKQGVDELGKLNLSSVFKGRRSCPFSIYDIASRKFAWWLKNYKVIDLFKILTFFRTHITSGGFVSALVLGKLILLIQGSLVQCSSFLFFFFSFKFVIYIQPQSSLNFHHLASSTLG